MGKLQEYLKLIPRGIANLDKVIEGLANEVKMEFGVLPQDDVDVIVGRRLICSHCPHNSINATKLGVYATKRTDEHCIMCGCPIITKTASLESDCGIEQYNKNNPFSPLDLRWTKVK